MPEEIDPEEFRDSYFAAHEWELTDRAEYLWDQLGLFDLMHEASTQTEWLEELHALYDSDSIDFDAEWAELMDEFLDMFGLDDIDDLEGWYNGA